MPRSLDDWRRSEATSLPGWIKPQLTRLVDQAPEGPEWLHEIKFDGYRMHARLDRGRGPAADPHRARLDFQIPGNCIGRGVASGATGLSRRRAVRRPARWHHLVQPDPECVRHR